MATRIAILTFFSLLWLAAGYMAIYTLGERPLLPGTFQKTEKGLRWSVEIGENAQAVYAGADSLRLLLPAPQSSRNALFAPPAREVLTLEVDRIGDQAVREPFEIEEILYHRAIGDTLSITPVKDLPVRVRLGVFYDFSRLLSKGLAGLLFITIALLVWFYRQQDGEKYFAIAGYLFGFTIMAWWPGMHLPGIWAYLYRILVLLAYPQAIFAFLQFSYYFPAPVLPHHKLRFRRVLFQTIGFTISVILIVFFLLKEFQPDPQAIYTYYAAYRAFRIVVFALFMMAIVNIIRNEGYHSNPVTQRKLQWVIGGGFWGLFPFLFLWNLPQFLGLSPLLPEWTFDLFFMITPVFIAIGILRYRLFNIEIVISRSLVYGILLALLIAVYVAVAGGLSVAIHREFALDTPVLSILASLLVAFLFNPIREQVQGWVDRKFLRIRYDRFNRMKAFLSETEKISDTQHLLAALQKHFQEAVPVEQQLFLSRENDRSPWQPHQPDDQAGPLLEWLSHYEVPDTLTVNAEALKLVEKGVFIPVASLPEPWIILLPIRESLIWVLGRKKSRIRYWEEDLDLARQMAQSTATHWEKITYFEMAIRESLEKEQARKLSDWKSMLVNKVAHDLRTPLSTMLWRLTNLQKRLEQNAGGESPEPVGDLLKQVSRLQGFINSMLTLSRIEQGEHQADISRVVLRPQIDLILGDLEGIIRQKDIQVRITCPAELNVLGNPMMLQEIFLNLIDNACKFSPKGGTISLSARKSGEQAEIRIKDEAGGIPEQQLQQLFEPFGDGQPGDNGKGFNLGLYITRNFTRLQNGELTVASKEGKGTTITLSFPLAPEAKPREPKAAGTAGRRNGKSKRRG
ncbi:MAG TPA: ATP-binding protein [Calditrichia bacterium]|nr:ATP-binding protein [Calditrichia bacterium]